MSKIDELLKNEKVEWKKVSEVISQYKEKQKNDSKINLVYTVSKDFGIISSIDYWIKNNEGGKYTNYSEDISNYNIIRKNMFAYNPSRLNIGSIDCLFDKPEGVLSPMYVIFQVDERIINPKYLLYYLKSEKVLNLIDSKKEQGARFRFDFERWNFIKIPIPSLKTQEKIVKILDRFKNYVTELQAELQARNKQYDYYRDMLLSEEYLNKISMKMNMLTNKDYELKMTTLGEIAQVNRGASPRPIKKYITEDIKGIPWIKIGDVGVNSKYVTKTAQKITREGAKKSRILKKGDFIMSNSMSYGRPYILGIDGAIHDGWASISGFHNTLDSDFLYYYLTSSKVQNYWKGKINSSSVNNLNSEIICSLPIPVINKELQQVVAKVLDKFQSLLADTEGLLPEEIEKRQKQYEFYREKLLTFDENMV